MDDRSGPASTLRERKQQRTRDAIVEAALELFAQRGFDGVTVMDIAERAEVGRATFFRYFGDKQEVLFGDESELELVVAEAGRHPADGPIGDSLTVALALVRTIVVSFVERVTARPETFSLHERLVARHPELQARSLTKQRRYAEELTKVLVAKGADDTIAAQASEIGLACYYAAQTVTDNDPERLPRAVEEMFGRLLT